MSTYAMLCFATKMFNLKCFILFSSLNNSKESNSTESIAADACSVQVDGEWCTEFEYDKSMFMSTIVTDVSIQCNSIWFLVKIILNALCI